MVAGKCRLVWWLSLSALMYLQTQHFPQMTDYQQEIKDLTTTRSLRLLRDGFKSDFATFAYADERMTSLLHDLASEFVDNNIPVVDDDNQFELALMLLESLDIIAR
jgi:hypothetical protein